jgi:hypothetical protein
MSAGTKCSRSTPLLGLAFFTSAITAGCRAATRRCSAPAKSRRSARRSGASASARQLCSERARRAVATSSILRRRWAGGHHLLQPHTGRPAHSDIVQATVLADCGWRAEAAATVGVIRGASSADWLVDRGCMPYLLGVGDG